MRRFAHFELSGYEHFIISIRCTEVNLDHLIEVNLLILIITLNKKIVLYFLSHY